MWTVYRRCGVCRVCDVIDILCKPSNDEDIFILFSVVNGVETY